MLGALGLLVEVFEDVGDDLSDPLRREQRVLLVDRAHLLVGDRLRRLHRVDVVDAERQHVLVGDGVDDRVRVQLVAERLLGGPELRVAAARRVGGEDRRAGEPEEVVALERLGDRRVHVAELRAVALVEDDHHVAVVDLVALVAGDERAELLDRRDDDPSTGILELPLQDGGRRVRVRSSLLEAVVLLHRLVVEVLAVDDEQHLVDRGELAGELGRLEAGERLARTGGVPHVPAGGDRAPLLVVGGDVDPSQDLLGRHDLVRAHHEQHPVGGQHAVPGEDVQQRVLGEERLREAGEILDRLVGRVGPPAREVEAVRRLASPLPAGCAHRGAASGRCCCSTSSACRS